MPTVQRDAPVLHYVTEIHPWREWARLGEQEAMNANGGSAAVGQRLPPVGGTAPVALTPPQAPLDPCPVPADAAVDVEPPATEVAQQPERPATEAAAAPQTVAQAAEPGAAAGTTSDDDGTLVNPFYKKEESAAVDEPTEPELTGDIEPISDDSPADQSITDAVIPGHLQQSWLQIIRGGYELASRGALFAARQEFERALYEITQTKDQLSGGRHTQALARALRACREAVDFLPAAGAISAPLQTKIVLDGHQTPIARELSPSLPATALFEAYHRYAEEQMALAVGGTRAGSMALHALGKLHDRLASIERDRCRDAADLAVTYQRSAIRAHGGNYLAANELGVLLARGGDYVRARQMFVRSLQLAPSSEAQYNLQVTDRRLAEMQGHPVPPAMPVVAAQPRRRPQVRWLPVEQFVAGGTMPAAPLAQGRPRAAPTPAGQAFPGPRFRR